jgi:hypothetical protein
MTPRRFIPLFALLVTLAAAPPFVAQEPPAPGVQFTAYPSYGAKFDSGSGKFSLVTNMLVYNLSGKTVTDVTFKQTYPDGVTVKETFQRDVGTEATGETSSARKVEGNAFYASMPTWKNRQYVVIFNELEMARRLNNITFPGVEISYTDAEGKRQTAKLADNTYDLFIYSNVVGDLNRFLKKYNKIDLDFVKATPNRKEWEFAPIVASARGRFPTGVIGTFPGSDDYSGYFRIRTGPPGDMLQLVVKYDQTQKTDAITTEDAAMSQLRDLIKWCGEFEMVPDGLKVTPGKWKNYKDAFVVGGQWKDTIAKRLGGGPLTARVFWGPREDVQYTVLGLGHGRGLMEKSLDANPEKEAALLKELDALIETFRSDIVPSAYDRRH